MRKLYHRFWIKVHWLLSRYHQTMRFYQLQRRDIHWLAYRKMIDKED